MSARSIRISISRPLFFAGPAKIVLLVLLMSLPVVADEALSPRIQIGVSLFPSIVAAVRNLRDQVDPGQKINIYLVYQNNDALAQALKQKLISRSKIKNYAVSVLVISQTELYQLPEPVKGVLFITEPVSSGLSQLNQFAISNQMLSYSPFKGDVERGVATGYQVTDKVLPLVNIAALRNANIELKAFFMRIAVKYE